MEYTATGSKGDAAPEGKSVKYLRTNKLGRDSTRRNDKSHARQKGNYP